MPLETELKFKLSTFPELDVVPFILTQTYLDINNTSTNLAQNIFKCAFSWDHIKEMRVREKIFLDNISYTLTLKSDGLLDRDEYETKIEKSIYDNFMELSKLGTINKFRYATRLPNTGLTIELDNYSGKLKGLYIAEVEYDKNNFPDNSVIIDDVKRFLGDDIIDVTFDQQFKNKFLATKQ